MSKSKNPYPKRFLLMCHSYRFLPDGTAVYVVCDAIAHNGWYRILAAEDIHQDGVHIMKGYQLLRSLRYWEITDLVRQGIIILYEEEHEDNGTSCDADSALNDLM